MDSSLEAVLTDQTQRDTADSGRAVAPLKAADDAVHVDSSSMPLSDVVRTLEQEIERRRATGGG